MKGFKLIGLVALGLLFTHCATKVTGLRKSDSFQFPAVVSGKMMIGGVTSTTEKIEEGKQSSLSTLLRNQLLEERKGFPIAPAGSLSNQIGKNKYKELITEYETNGILSPTSLNFLKQKVQNVRYLAFARIEDDNINQDRRETEDRDKDGKIIPGTSTVTATTNRTVSASMSIYDLTEMDLAWNGSVSKSASKYNECRKHTESELVSVIKAIKGSASESRDCVYPAPAEMNTLVTQVFRGFAENMPEQD